MHPTLSYYLARARPGHRPPRGPSRPGGDRSRDRATGADPAGSSQPEWTAIMCTHDPACPPADAIDWRPARNITEHPGQGWTLLCNGAVALRAAGGDPL